jgi:molybdopterin molybdotransferase
MTQLKDDCFAFGGPLMSAGDALALLAERVQPVAGSETLPLAAAQRRILAQDVISAGDVPPFANAAVDGYAFAFAGLQAAQETRLKLAGRAAAGHPWARPCRPGEAIRVFTGAAMPESADTVAMQEDVRVEGDAVIVPPGLHAGANRRRAGEDVPAGQVALAKGARLRPQDVALAAATGHGSLQVYRPLRIALFSTGDELLEPGQRLGPGQIYDANRYLLLGLLGELPARVDDLGILPDRANAVREALAAAAAAHDLIITSGGVSTGEEDHVKGAVEALGSLHFWRLAIKPGRPIALGQIGDCAFVGLPGNPVAVMVCFLRFAKPIILRLCGATDLAPAIYRVRADFEHTKRGGRREWVRASLVAGADGELVARKFARQGSGLITSLVNSDGLVELREDTTHLRPGTLVDFLPFMESGARAAGGDTRLA